MNVINKLLSSQAALLVNIAFFSAYSAAQPVAPKAYAHQLQGDSKIYKIEVIIFERLTNADHQEKWQKNIRLSYPSIVQPLLAPLPQEAEDETLKESKPALPNDTVFADSETNLLNLTDNQKTSDYEEATPQIRYFERLPIDAKELSSQAQALKSKKLRVLFHESWQQPVHSSEHSASILIQGGNQYGDHYELEGTITFSVSRYLHAASNLWLTTFEPNFGQPPYYWPPVPQTPEFSSIQIPLEATDTQAPQSDTPTAKLEAIESLESFDTLEPTDSSTLILPESTISFTGTQPKLSLGELKIAPHSESAPTLQRSHLIKEIVTIDQSRKMRSNELHYIDHPRIGLLIKISPVELEPEQDS